MCDVRLLRVREERERHGQVRPCQEGEHADFAGDEGDGRLPFQVKLPVRAHEARDGPRHRVHLGRRRALETAPTRHGYRGIHIPCHENESAFTLRVIIA